MRFRTNELAAWMSGLTMLIAFVAIASRAEQAGASMVNSINAEHIPAKGICVVLGAGDGSMAIEIAEASELLVHCLDVDSEKIAAAKTKAAAKGLLGKRVVFETFDGKNLPHASNLVDQVSGQHFGRMSETLLREIERVLRPGGRSILTPENLGESAQELGKILYEEAAKKQAAEQPAGEQTVEPEPESKDKKKKGGDDVIDAEFEAKDDE